MNNITSTQQHISSYKLDNTKVGKALFLDNIKQEFKNMLIAEFVPKKTSGWETSNKYFNKLTNGLSDIVVLAGAPGGTKSTIARHLALQFLKTDPYNKTLFLSAEDTKDEFYNIIKAAILNVNRNIFATDFKTMCPHIDAGSFSEFLLDQTMEVQRDNPEGYEKYCKLINRLEYSTKGEKVFESKERLVHVIMDSLLGYSNQDTMDKPLNELLVVLDHLGEFNLANTTNEYERLNDILETVMGISGGYTDLTDEELKNKTGGQNPFVYNIEDKIRGQEEKYERLKARYKKKYESFIMSCGADFDEFLQDVIKNTNIPRIKFLLLSQFNTESVKPSNYIKHIYELNTTALESSKRLGQKALQVLYCWKENSPNTILQDISPNMNEAQRKHAVKEYIQPMSSLSYIYSAKGRKGASGWICPVSVNLITGTIAPVALRGIKTEGILTPHNFQDFRKELGIEFIKEERGREGDTGESWFKRHQMIQKSIISAHPSIHDTNYIQDFIRQRDENNEFFKMFSMNKLYQ